jgi:PAS domain S-box-containing protein
MTAPAPARGAESASLPTWLRSSSVAWAGALLAGVVMALTAGFLVYEKRALETSEIQSAELYARVLQDHAERTFNTVDIAMGSLADSLGTPTRGNDAVRVDKELTQALGGLPFLRSLSLIEGDGRVVASSSAANIGARVDTGSIPLPADGATEALGSSVNGRDLIDASVGQARPASAARSFVPLVRRVGDPSGQRLYLVAALNPDFFGNEYELTLADRTRAAGIFSIGGTLLAATGNIRMGPGESAGAHASFATLLPAREIGSFVGAGIDGEKVVTAFRVLRKRPIVVIVERNHAHLQAGYRHTLYSAIGVGAGVLLVIAAMMVMGWRSLRGHEAVSAALQATRAGVESSERDLRDLVESVHELIFRADATGRIAFVNRRWQELTRRPAGEVLGKRLTDLCREDERQACLALFSKPETRDETLLVHVNDASGGSLTLDLSVSRVLDAEGRTAGFAGYAVDVSAREAARQALQSQLKFTEQLLEVSPTPIFVKDERGRFVTVNRAWLGLMNLTLPEVLGRDSADLFGDDAGKHREQDARILLSEERVSYENRLHVAGRAPRDTVVSKVRFSRADGTAAGIVGSIVDVTEFREAERNIRKARDAAQWANSAKSEFIANISHELRTPLQGILGFSEIGRDLSGDLPDFLDIFTDIHAGGQRMLTLVNGLLDVSQLESAVGSLPLQRVDVAPLVRDVLGQLQTQTSVRGLKVNVLGLAEPVEGDVDRVRFQQAVRSVLANAIRYSPVGGVIDVTLANQGRAGIELTVRDHGPGVPEDELERIFEAFVQSSRTRDGSGGTGLGLTITRKIMSAHGGSVVAANAKGGGTLIRLSLPASGMAGHSQADASGQGADVLLLASEEA